MLPIAIIFCHVQREILNILERSDGLTIRQLEETTNLSYGQIEKVLKFISVENPAPVIKMNSHWKRTSVPFIMDHARIQHLTLQRVQEWAEVKNYLHSTGCLMNYLRIALDDPTTQSCGKCATCLEQPIVKSNLSSPLIHQAASFLKHAEISIPPKKQVATNAFIKYGYSGNLKSELQAEEGRVLSRWGDAAWGRLVLEDKHANYFRDELVDAAVDMILNRWKPDPFPAWVCCVPSLNHPKLVPSFAKRLAEKLNLPYVDAFRKIRANQPQKLQQNRFHQCRNLDGVFEINSNIHDNAVLLVDDIIDSGWTFTVLAALLKQAGSGKVYPFALASTAIKDS